MESNDSPEIPDRGETSDIPGLPSGAMDDDGNFEATDNYSYNPDSFRKCCKQRITILVRNEAIVSPTNKSI